MFKEVALDPQCMSEYHYYGLLKSNFGEDKGRFVVASVKSWVKEAVQAVKNSTIDPVKKQSIKSFLNRLQKNKNTSLFVYPMDRSKFQNKDDSDWLSWFKNQQVYRCFIPVISERKIDGAINYEDIINGDAKWSIPPTIRIDKTLDDIESVLLPLLRLGENLVIVDQYFSLTPNKILKRIMMDLQEIESISEITLVTSINTKNPQKVFNDEFKTVYEYLPSFNLVIAPERYFHDRYIITNNGSIKSGHGFALDIQKGTQADKLSIGICSASESRETLDWVDKAINEGKATKISLGLNK